MKKLLFLLILFIPFFVFAKECKNEISIEKVEFVKTEGKATELHDAKIDNQVVKFDVRFSKLNDSVEYKLLIKNNSDEDYQIDKNSIKSNNKNVSYILNYGDTSVVEAGKEKEIDLVIKYDKKVDNKLFVNNEYEVNNEMTFTLINNQQENPLTKGGLILAIIIVILAWLLLLFAEYRKNKIVISVGVMLLFIPFIVNALCNMVVKTDSHFVIEKVPVNRCYFDGVLEKGAIYTNGQYEYAYQQEQYLLNRWVDMEYGNDGWGMNLIDKASTDPVTTEMCAYINDIPVTSMKYMYNYSKATSIDLSSFYTKNIVNMQGVFQGVKAKNLDLSTFDTSSVKTMWGMFAEIDVNGVDFSYLDTSNVENMTFMFAYANIDTLDLSAFNTSNVESMEQMFIKAKINNLDLSTFDVSKVTNMEWMFREFEGNVNTHGWTTSSLENMKGMFMESKIGSLDLKNFDTSKVTNMDGVFQFTEIDEIDASSFTLDSVSSVHGLFVGTTAKTVDISGMVLETNKKLTNMFCSAPNLTTVYANPNLDYTKLLPTQGSTNFCRNTSIIGGQGTVCKNVPNGNEELSYFRVDGGVDAPGCFTAK